METYLLFIYGTFEDLEDIDFLCTEIIAVDNNFKKVRYIVENNKNLIVIFESESDKKTISENLHILLSNETVKFYFVFNRQDVFTANLSLQMKDFIFNPITNHTTLILEFDDPKETTNQSELELNVLLDKI